MSYDVEKRKWLDKLFKYERDKDNLYHLKLEITHVLYFNSKMYYIGRENDDKYFMCYFGHVQPCISNLNKSLEYIDNIENINDLPSTIVPIEDVCEIMDTSCINDLAENILVDQTVDDTINKYNDSRVRSILSDEVREYFTILDNEGDKNDDRVTNKIVVNNTHFGLLSSFICSSDKLSSSQREHLIYKNSIVDNINLYISSNDNCIRKDKVIDNSNNLFNNLILSKEDKRKVEDYRTLIIGHAIRIGEVNTNLFKPRYTNVSESNFTNLHHTSIEMDNHWRYHNYMTLEDDERSVDETFSKFLSYENMNLEPILKNNESVNVIINDSYNEDIKEINENKLNEDIEHYNFFEYNNHNERRLNHMMTSKILKTIEDDEYSLWIKKGIESILSNDEK